MENADLESCLNEAKYLGLSAKRLFEGGSREEAFQLKFDEIRSLENAYQNTPKESEENGVVAGYLGESYSSLAKFLYKSEKEDIEYLQKSRDVLKAAFDVGRLPKFAYSTYLFVLHRLLERATTPEEKLPYARENAWVLSKAADEGRRICYSGKFMPAKVLLRFAIHNVVELEEQIKSVKTVIV